MRKAGTSGRRRRARDGPREPDARLVRGPGVQYRYVLGLAASHVAAMIQALDEAGAELQYLVVVRAAHAGRYRAYVGLGSSEQFDFALRLAARGIHIERGEEVSNGRGGERVA